MAIESKMRRVSAFGQPDESPPRKKKFAWMAAALVLLALAALAYWWSGANWTRTAGMDDSAPSAYQAVFLDNGQTYFGRLDATARDGQYRLSDVFYVDFRQKADDPALSASDLKLVKLGGEVHGPDDLMVINPAHVLYYENLRGDSKVAQAILNYVQTNAPASGL